MLAARGCVSVLEVLLSAEATLEVFARILFHGVHNILLHLIADSCKLGLFFVMDVPSLFALLFSLPGFLLSCST